MASIKLTKTQQADPRFVAFAEALAVEQTAKAEAFMSKFHAVQGFEKPMSGKDVIVMFFAVQVSNRKAFYETVAAREAGGVYAHWLSLKAVLVANELSTNTDDLLPLITVGKED